MGISVKSELSQIEKIAKSVLKDDEFADIMLYERNSLDAKNIQYIFTIKVAHSPKSEEIYLSFMEHYYKTMKLFPYKSKVILENSKLKELFFLKSEVRNIG